MTHAINFCNPFLASTRTSPTVLLFKSIVWQNLLLIKIKLNAYDILVWSHIWWIAECPEQKFSSMYLQFDCLDVAQSSRTKLTSNSNSCFRVGRYIALFLQESLSSWSIWNVRNREIAFVIASVQNLCLIVYGTNNSYALELSPFQPANTTMIETSSGT